MVAAAATAHLWAIAPVPDVNTIVQRSMQANNRDWQVAPQYDYFERDRNDGTSRTYRVTMIFGSPYRQLVALDGEPLSAQQRAAEQSKLEQATARRRNESPRERTRRNAEYRKERQRDHQMIEQLAAAFNFRLAGQQKQGSRDVYVLEATPRAGYVPPTRNAAVLTGMRGTLWVDAQTFQWIKVEAEVTRPVQIAGFVARVMPGTRFALEYAPVTSDVWLPTHYTMQSHARLLYVFSRRDQADESYYGYTPHSLKQ